MKKIFISLLLLAGCSSGQLHLENDYGAFFNPNNDKYFTHGTKFSYHSSDSTERYRDTYSIGQNIYTPSKKHTDALPSELSDNRPYTGWLYAEYRKATINSDRTKSIWGIQAGCSGRCSHAKETQTEIHKLLGQGYPTWDRNYSLKSEPGVILEKEKYYEFYANNNFYVDYFSRLKLGNIIDNLSLGTSFKFGHQYAEFDPEPIIFKGPREESSGSDPWSYYLYGDTEVRCVPYNHFLQGSLFQEERHTVDANMFVGEANLGVRVGYENLKFSYNYTVITDEWEGQNGPFFFGGLDVSW